LTRHRLALGTRVPAIVAHRGSSVRFRENTLEAFRGAAAEGADLFELDIWLSADGVPMVHHDETVSGGRPIGSLTHAEIVGGPDTAHIPALDDVLDWSRDRIGVYVELKGPGTAQPVAAAVRRRAMADQVVVGSFDARLVAAVRAVAPELSMSILYHPTDVDALIELGLELGVAYVHPCWKLAGQHPHTLLPRVTIERIHAAGMGVVTWDEDRPDELEGLLEAGSDAVSTNLPLELAMLREQYATGGFRHGVADTRRSE
jgi:glycerophosphoryl diester phosphodiesterase